MAVVVFAEPYSTVRVRGVLLGIAAIGGLHLLGSESALAHLGQWVFDCGPLDQKIGQIHDLGGAAARDSHLCDRDVSALQEVAQIARISRSEGAHNRLIGVADPDPIATRPHQQRDQLLLQGDAVLRLVLQDEGPTPPVAAAQIRVLLQHLYGHPYQIVEVEAADGLDLLLVEPVDFRADPQKQVAIFPAANPRQEVLGPQPAVLGRGDDRAGHFPRNVAPLLLPLLIHVFPRPQPAPHPLVVVVPSPHRLVEQTLAGALVEDHKFGCGPHQPGIGLDDAVGQAVQGSHVVADLEHIHFLQALADPGADIVHSRVLVRHDQHLPPLGAPLGDQPSRQGDNRRGLTAAGHR